MVVNAHMQQQLPISCENAYTLALLAACSSSRSRCKFEECPREERNIHGEGWLGVLSRGRGWGLMAMQIREGDPSVFGDASRRVGRDG